MNEIFAGYLASEIKEIINSCPHAESIEQTIEEIRKSIEQYLSTVFREVTEKIPIQEMLADFWVKYSSSNKKINVHTRVSHQIVEECFKDIENIKSQS